MCMFAAFLLTLYEIQCHQKRSILLAMNILMFMHHFGKIFIWLSPFFITNVWLLLCIAVVWLYVCIQNVLRHDVDQPCILSNYVNKVCGQSENEMLRDVMYHSGLKKDVQTYQLYFNIASWLLLFMIILKIVFILFLSHKPKSLVS